MRFLTALVLLSTTACGSHLGDDLTGDTTYGEAESGITLAPVNTATTERLTIDSSASKLVRPSKPPTEDACSNYDYLTAAIASRTLDCLGTIGPDQYGVDQKGNLAPRFDKCTQDTPKAKEAREDIIALLSTQSRGEDWATAQRCIAGAWSSWATKFKGTGIRECPFWEDYETVHPANEENVKAIIEKLPKLPVREGGVADPIVPIESYKSKLTFKSGKVDPRCKDEADCARQCMGGFRGGFIEGSGNLAQHDPTYWLISLDFGKNDPFDKPEYYHTMSFYGSPPGALYGHRNREGEKCSRFIIDQHILLTLKRDCLDYSDISTCLTICTE